MRKTLSGLALLIGLTGTSYAQNFPQNETALISIVERGQQQYSAGSNEMAKGASRPSRAVAICQQFQGLFVTNWIGKISKLSTNGSGKGVLAVDIGSNISIKTHNNDLFRCRK